MIMNLDRPAGAVSFRRALGVEATSGKQQAAVPLVLPAGSPEPPAMALRSRSPAVHERTVLLDGKHGLDLESGSQLSSTAM